MLQDNTHVIIWGVGFFDTNFCFLFNWPCFCALFEIRRYVQTLVLTIEQLLGHRD